MWLPRTSNLALHYRDSLVKKMEDYLKQLHAEAKGVEERIAELGKGPA